MPQKYHSDWWSKERVVEGLKRAYRDHKHAPTSASAWQVLTGGTGCTNGVDSAYPSSYAILKHFRTFRQAWDVAGVPINRSREDWTEEEDWLLREGAGILTRDEMAELTKRSPNAVHRRLYDLGIHARTAPGWTVHRVARAAHVRLWDILQHVRTGRLPCFKGSACRYVDLNALPRVAEIAWDKASPELVDDVRRSLMKRLVSLIARGNYG